MVLKTYTDQVGREIHVQGIPKRIISCVPSITELLFDLELGDRVVGRTRFCIHPHDQIKKIPVIGGTKNIHLDRIKVANPDLIFANKEENDQAQIEAIAKEFPVWVSDISSLVQSLDMIKTLGEIMGKTTLASTVIRKTKELLRGFDKDKLIPVAYLIWKNPYMSVGGDTYIHDMLNQMGFENVFKDRVRYPEIDIAALAHKKPAYIFLSSEPYPFKQKHLDELQSLVPQSKVLLVDGEFFSWYGSRLIHKTAYPQKFKDKLFAH